ncbi:concanavalin A-like lectin/glucanase domain-containing protein [Gigaspora rosea]|uniref:Concanavalin A-like lectin/glucanase domain-containing protein n=1 Tax=Gigaspora rosea TaxID=44941 RepID=A0A397W935_9GLOM|nr:concanavalin A-like lectin/glucanase domain-containing protein [Gigaspora rosea]
MDLPSAWNLYDKTTYLSVDSNGLRVNYEGSGEYNEVGGIRANHPIPPQCKLFYFEIDIIDEEINKWIGIGFCEKVFDLNRMHEWKDSSWGYQVSYDYFFCSERRPNRYGLSYSTGDTIGCCLNFKHNTVLYTKNGICLGIITFRNLKDNLYPCVGLQRKVDL